MRKSFNIIGDFDKNCFVATYKKILVILSFYFYLTLRTVRKKEQKRKCIENSANFSCHQFGNLTFQITEFDYYSH